MNSVQGSTG